MKLRVAGRRVDVERENLLRRLASHLLDVHAAFGRSNDRDAGGRAVDEEGEIKLTCNGGALFDQEPLHDAACRSGLHRHKRIRQHLVGEEPDIVHGFRDPHAAFITGLALFEATLSASASMNLCFHDRDGAAQLLRDRNSFLWRESRMAPRNGNTIISEDRFRLIFMHIHGTALIVREKAKIVNVSGIGWVRHLETPRGIVTQY